ncbi:pantetheine-phosphate adenylyltransferase [Fusibacter tunisiensis]|uniref:Phosphopantetheine adenylyltransferase n=1 Tax=Fusibacter tunisiensis TaxID=1008308 RepID=A0ABS2MMB9_9FIRM|nr:pantetheine-phosphate adenylyltransferase [Fusibacter tunisiensis]MBM7560550.1 pantetheine-phosphate adenylyltransferase [Fusibacter tunisiensis]
MKTVVYPGSFDPVTLGHLDVIERASAVFGHVVVTVMINSTKTPMFTPEERVALLKEATGHLDNVTIDFHKGLLTDYLRERNLNILVKGLRVISDFEAEFQMASVNRKLLANLETVFIMTKTEYMYLSSSIVKEVAQYGGDISNFVTQGVQKAIERKVGGL